MPILPGGDTAFGPGVDTDLDYTYGGTFDLLAGDVHPSKDDYVNSMDLSVVSARIYASDVDADLNVDGVVNALDLSMVLVNLYERGEAL